MTTRVFVVLVAIFVFSFLAEAQALSVCQVLDRLSELNGREVQIRGAWNLGDTAEFVSASPPCQHQVVRDGWIWKNSIEISPDNLLSFREIYAQREKLEHQRPFANIMVTITGVLGTRDHFKINHSSHLPLGYGYFVAYLRFSKAENLEAVAMTPEELALSNDESISPWPVKVGRSATKR